MKEFTTSITYSMIDKPIKYKSFELDILSLTKPNFENQFRSISMAIQLHEELSGKNSCSYKVITANGNKGELYDENNEASMYKSEAIGLCHILNANNSSGWKPNKKGILLAYSTGDIKTVHSNVDFYMGELDIKNFGMFYINGKEFNGLNFNGDCYFIDLKLENDIIEKIKISRIGKQNYKTNILKRKQKKRLSFDPNWLMYMVPL